MQPQRSPKINFREIFWVVRFSTFATISAQSGHAAGVAGCPLLRDERTYPQTRPKCDKSSFARGGRSTFARLDRITYPRKTQARSNATVTGRAYSRSVALRTSFRGH